MPVHGLILARGDNIVSSHNDTQDVIMHVIPIAGSDPTSLCFCLFWFGCGCVFFVCLVSFVSGCVFLVSCWDSSLDCVQVHYQYFCGYRQVDSMIIRIHLFAAIERV